MRSPKRFVIAALALLVVAAVVLFMLENTQPVALSFLGWPAPQLPVSVCVLVSLLAGMMVGPLLAWFMGARRRLK
ncbi:LapA family protein [Pseudomonas sp. R3-41]